MFQLNTFNLSNLKQWRLEMTTAIVNTGLRTMGVHTPIASIFGLASIAKTVSVLAIPAISMFALANLPTASARKPIKAGSADDCTKCMEACDKIEFEIFKLACYAFCLFKVC